VQYHPEYDLMQLLQLYRLYAGAMVEEGFFADEAELDSYLAKLERLIEAPSDMGLRWQLGIDEDVLDDRTRNGEIVAWIEQEVLKKA
jgi:GMP synthase (glutamine-hydrolysing)